MDTTQDQALTPRQAADFLGVKWNTVARNAKKLGGVKVGRLWRFSRAKLTAYLQGAATATASIKTGAETGDATSTPPASASSARPGRLARQKRASAAPRGRRKHGVKRS